MMHLNAKIAGLIQTAFVREVLINVDNGEPIGIGKQFLNDMLHYTPIEDGIPQWDDQRSMKQHSAMWFSTRLAYSYPSIESCYINLPTLYHTWAEYRKSCDCFMIDHLDGNDNFDGLRRLLITISETESPHNKLLLAMVADFFRAENFNEWNEDVIEDEEYGIPSLIGVFERMLPTTKALGEWSSALLNIRETINHHGLLGEFGNE